MVLGASVGFLVSYLVGSNTLGLLAALAVGALFGLVFAYTTTMLRLDQFVIGLALYFAALGLGSLLYRAVVGVTLSPPLIPTLSDYPIPGCPASRSSDRRSSAMTWSSTSPSCSPSRSTGSCTGPARGCASGPSERTPSRPTAPGSSCSRRGCGMWAGIIGAALMTMAGAYLPMVYTGTFTEGMVAGRGWLVIALTFLGGWRPHLVVAGAAFFAGMEVLALQVQVTGVGIPHQFVLMLPYVGTLVVMIFAFRWARQPAFLGQNYDRESRLSG